MNVSTLAAPQGVTAVGQTAPAARTSAPVRAPARPRRRTGRSSGPQARPSRPVTVGPVGHGRVLRPKSCTVDAPTFAPAAPRPSAWRLTERGIALVLVTGLLIVTAAVTVIGLTALRVTGDNVVPPGQSVLAQP